jgi:hypothetical protein
MENKAKAIRDRATRKLGFIMAKQAETVGLAKGALRRGSAPNPRKPTDPPSLAEAGIGKRLANRARRLSTLDDKAFEERTNEVLKTGYAPLPKPSRIAPSASVTT